MTVSKYYLIKFIVDPDWQEWFTSVSRIYNQMPEQVIFWKQRAHSNV